MKRVLAAVVAVGAGIALVGGAVAVHAARETQTKGEQLRQQRQAAHPKHTVKAVQGHAAQKQKKPRGTGSPDVVGTVTYEPGAPADSFASEPGGNNIVTNRFNSALGGPLQAGNLTGVTFFPGAVQGTAIVSVLGPPAGTTAPILNISYITGIGSNTFNTVGVGPVAVGPDFMAGLYVGAFAGTDQIGIRNASLNGQGFHAHQMNFFGSIATGVVALPGQNAIFRATGNILTPVELMDFKIQ